MPTRPSVLLLLTSLVLAPLLAAPATARAVAPERDPLRGILARIERYLRQNEVDGVTMDWRYAVSPSEEIRQTVVCQVLGYAELHRLHPRPRLRAEIVEHADFMLGRLEEIRSHGPFDGMLAHALWSAWETTGEERFLAAAFEVGAEMRAIPTETCILNGGLMVAMATAKEWELTGNAEARRKAHDIVAGLVPYQNDDGSFPHWCYGTRDVHYTAWMAMELIHVARLLDDPHIPALLARMNGYLEGRIGPDGRTVYESPCPWSPSDCTIRHWSRGSGCSIDYDTRAWTVEPAYCALLFDRTGSPRYEPVLRFLDALEDRGTLADMYAHWPPPEDPEYPWTIADTSVVNMSVIFWALATTVAERARRDGAAGPALFELEDPAGEPWAAADEAKTPPRHGLSIGPNPARGACRIRFALERPGPARLEVHDARGRRVRTLVATPLAAGGHEVPWDGRDEAGRQVPRGSYFAVLDGPGGRVARRFAFVR